MREHNARCPDFDWCATDHNLEPGHHYGLIRYITDLDGRAVEISLFHVPDTGRTGVSVGGYEISLAGTQALAQLLHTAVAAGIEIPGVLAELTAGGAR